MSVLTDLLMPDMFPAADENWRGQSSCARTDPDAWFKDAGSRSDFEKKVCSRCQVKVLCLGLALTLEDDPDNKAWGVWGELDASQRRALTPQQRRYAITAALEVQRSSELEAA